MFLRRLFRKKMDPWPHHDTTMIPEVPLPVDVGIAPLVSRLNRCGFRTCCSCEGHPRYSLPFVVIHRADAPEFLRFFIDLCEPEEDIKAYLEPPESGGGLSVFLYPHQIDKLEDALLDLYNP